MLIWEQEVFVVVCLSQPVGFNAKCNHWNQIYITLMYVCLFNLFCKSISMFYLVCFSYLWWQWWTCGCKLMLILEMMMPWWHIMCSSIRVHIHRCPIRCRPILRVPWGQIVCVRVGVWCGECTWMNIDITNIRMERMCGWKRWRLRTLWFIINCCCR